MFGFEFQTANIYVKGGCAERQVAFVHENGRLTLEADEGHLRDGSTDLEFVTAACQDWAVAEKVIGDAAALAAELAKRGTGSKSFDVRAGEDKAARGRWLIDCTIKINDPKFEAAMQGTLGVALPDLPELIQRVYSGIPARKRKLDEIERRAKATIGWLGGSPALAGFVTAVHAFLLEAMEPEPPVYPALNYDSDRYDPLYEFTNDPYVHGLGIFDVMGRWDVVMVGADGPKVLFPLLPRTDWYHLLRALVGEDLKLARAWLAGLADGHELTAQGARSAWLFPYPYRADPTATDTNQRVPKELLSTRHVWNPSSEEPPKDEPWLLVSHGPSLADWVASVLDGDKARGSIRKDVASPPPGWPGRRADSADLFPQPNEDKRYYYGMGAFPVDIDPKTSVPLAVFEHRYLNHDDAFRAGSVPAADWVAMAKRFHDRFVQLR